MNITLQEYLHAYAEYRKKYNTASPYGLSSTYSEFSKFFYICVWAWGLALEELQSSRYIHHSYSIPELQQKLSSKLISVKFEGVSGVFNTNASNKNITLYKATLSQFCHGKLTPRQFIKSIENGCLLAHEATFALPLHLINYVYLFMVCVQVLLLAVLQILTVIYRKEPTIKAADVLFLHICFTGAYILHIGSVLDILSQIFTNFDFVNLLLGVIIIVWLVPIGATLLVSPIISRSWRVYRFFVHTFHPGKCLTSYKFPVRFITIFSLVDLILATVVTVLIFYADHFNYSYGESEEAILLYKALFPCLGIKHFVTCHSLVQYICF